MPSKAHLAEERNSSLVITEKNTTDIHRKIICVLTVIVKQSSVFQVSGSYSAVFVLQR